MRKFLFNIIHRLRTCTACHGQGTVERGSSGPVKCKVCDGKGYVR